MKRQRRITWTAACAGAFVVLVNSGTKSMGQSDELLRQSTLTLQEASKNAAANRLAIERYRFLKRLAPTYDSPIFQGGFFACSALFPFGRSDRMYVIVWNTKWPESYHGDDRSCVLCYQRNGDRDKLVYTAAFDTVNHGQKLDRAEVEKMQPMKSVADYIRAQGVPFTGAISKYAKKDLESAQDYVSYKYITVVGTLEISPLSTLYSDGKNDREDFEFDKDPLTKARLKPGEFYKKYGLPVSLKEWAALKASKA